MTHEECEKFCEDLQRLSLSGQKKKKKKLRYERTT